MKLRKGDNILVIKGRDRGKRGVIMAVDPATSKVKIEGVSIVKRHLKKASRPGIPGGITEKVLPIHAAKVMLVCANCHQPTRVGHKLVNDKKERICKNCQAIIAYVKG
jgi:large subunit ribosomal protein L24